MRNLLFLMAGSSDAFKNAGYIYPKNLTEIENKALVEHVIGNVSVLLNGDTRLICVLNRDELRQYHTGDMIRLLDKQAIICEAPGPTKGAACTALLAIDHINNGEPLIIVNGDIVMHVDSRVIMDNFTSRNLDGGIIVFQDVHPRWSFVKVNEEGLVVEAAEKRPISRYCTTGFYYFACGRDFVDAASAMIKKGGHVNGLFYVCPSYNEMILQQKRIGIYEIPKEAYFSLKDPHGVQIYENYLRSKEGKDINSRV